MAQSTQTMRVILVPLAPDASEIQALFTLPALQQAAANGWFSAFYAHEQFSGDMVLPAPQPTVERVIRVEIVTTPADDANLVATSLPALQSELGLSSTIPTWSFTVTFGY